MQKFTQIKFNEVDIKKINDFKTSFVIQPLERGFGNTLGNALRRVMLSSVEHIAVFGIKIANVSNEFTTLKNVREDVVNIILNIKDVVFKFNPTLIKNDDILIVSLKSEGDIVTAKDLILPPGVEVVNPSTVIAHCEKNGALKFELYLKLGKGFVPFSKNKEFLSYQERNIDTKISTGRGIAIDSNFSPVKSVSYSVEELNSSAEQIEEKLTINVESTGVLKAKNIISQAAHILISHLSILKDVSEIKFEEDLFIEQKENKEESKIMLTPIMDLELSVRSFNALKKSGISKVHELVALKREELESIKHLGKKSLNEILEKLDDLGVKKNGVSQ